MSDETNDLLEKFAPWRKEAADIIPLPGTNANIEGLTFSEALERAFWEAGGIQLLRRVANESPLEFVKLCSKMIPLELKNESNNNLTVIVNTLKDNDSKV